MTRAREPGRTREKNGTIMITSTWERGLAQDVTCDIVNPSGSPGWLRGDVGWLRVWCIIDDKWREVAGLRLAWNPNLPWKLQQMVMGRAKHVTAIVGVRILFEDILFIAVQ